MTTEHAENSLQRGLTSIHKPFADFIKSQQTASIMLLIATVAALWWANSAQYPNYQQFIHTPIGFFVGDYHVETSLKHLTNDGLMVIFFFLLGLEIKREVIAGELAQVARRQMLVMSALGGMLLPAFIYLSLNWSLDSQHGWGIPMATDTAFALGAMMIVKRYVPSGLLTFIVGLAIVDDIGAILVIAIFYSTEISLIYLVSAFILLGVLFVMNYAGVRRPLSYALLGGAIWWMILNSGVHPTIAGVLVALTVPARPKLPTTHLLNSAKRQISTMQRKHKSVDVLANQQDHQQMLTVRDDVERATTPLRRWEDALDLPVSMIILPLFAFSNAGIMINLETLSSSVMDPVGMGIILGLILGKITGISSAVWLGLRYRLGALPDGVNIKHVIGGSAIAGIGFTMATFIATLAFEPYPEILDLAKSSVILASVLSAILGLFIIRFANK